ncbi:hypothetical protein EBT25_01100 [bacterium]|jgi:hypothetical protein|nr:hypothetical protein [bacterium]
MTNNIYPPDHLLRKWEELIIDEEQNVDVVLYEAFQAGADLELEACCEWLRSSLPGYDKHYADYLHAARRPKPPSLKKQALAELELLRGDANAHGLGFDAPAIRRALEQLDD